MMHLSKGNSYTFDLINKFYMKCDVDMFSYSGAYSVWKKNNALDSSRDTGERYLLKLVGKHVYQCEKVFNVNDLNK